MRLSAVSALMYSMTVQGDVAYPSFAHMVRRATATSDIPQGISPYPYQQRIADDGFPELVQVPTGSGKTLAVVLPWLWRRLFHPDETVRQATPRRLVVALPTRALIDQTERVVSEWLEGLDVAENIALHVMMGGGRLAPAQLQQWRRDLFRPTIVVGTLDMIVSRALLRGYGTYRGSYPIDFALVCNGAQIVVDEIQLAPQATATLRQLAAFQRRCGTAEPSALTVMSATVDERILHTVDNPFDARRASRVTLGDGDVQGALAGRLGATRTVRRLFEAPPGPRDLAVALLAKHVEGTLTLAVVNTVETATETFRHLHDPAGEVPSLLIHSRFRAVERAQQMAAVDAMARLGAGGGIVVTTQCIEAGVDLDATTLVTESAPWTSVVQRAGRCNRAGRAAPDLATMWWFPSKKDKTQPYAEPDLAAAEEALHALEGEAVTSQRLADVGAALPQPDLVMRMLRWPDFERLFDTTPDLAGSDVDIGIYIRPDEDLDLQLAWVPDDWTPTGQAAVVPDEPLRCPVSVGRATKFVRLPRVDAWAFDPSRGRWLAADQRRLRPQDVVLVRSTSGGYHSALGFAADSTRPVVPDPRVDAGADPQAHVPESGSAAEEPGAVASEWVFLDDHLDATARQAQALTATLDPPGIPADLRRAVHAAASVHDLGKAHPDWQRALVAANPAQPPPRSGGKAFAKSPGNGPLLVVRRDGDEREMPRTGFRHELVSIFMLGTPAARGHLEALDVPARWHDLVRYLVAAHHGHVRLTARDPQWDGRDGTTLLGCQDGEATPAWHLGPRELPTSRVDLGIFKAGGADSWSGTAAALLGELGPFRLAYLETLVRMADWRASAGLPLAGER